MQKQITMIIGNVITVYKVMLKHYRMWRETPCRTQITLNLCNILRIDKEMFKHCLERRETRQKTNNNESWQRLNY